MASVVNTDREAAPKRAALIAASPRERADGAWCRLAATYWPALASAPAISCLALPACSSVIGTILAAPAMSEALPTVKSMNALTSDRDSDFEAGYMNSGRPSGLYEPSWMLSLLG